MDFERLVDNYEKPIFNLIYRLIGDKDDAADLTQETFVAAYKSFSTFRSESSVYTWLYRIAINKCKNKFKENDRRRIYEGTLIEDDEVVKGTEAKSCFADGPDAAFERKELKELIEQAIGKLPPDYRIVAVLRDLQGMSYDEIAKAADLSIDVVRTRLARARGMLRQKLEPYLVE